MWLRATSNQHAVDTFQTTSTTCSTQAKVVATRSCSAGLGGARQVQRGCVSTVIGRCQQGYDVSASAAHSHDEQAASVSSGVQVQQMLHLQQAPTLTAALELQTSRQQLQHLQQHHHQQQQQDHHPGPLHWLTNGHSREHGVPRQPEQVQQCFLPDHLQLQQRQQGSDHGQQQLFSSQHQQNHQQQWAPGLQDWEQQQQQQQQQDHGVPVDSLAPVSQPSVQDVQQQQPDRQQASADEQRPLSQQQEQQQQQQPMTAAAEPQQQRQGPDVQQQQQQPQQRLHQQDPQQRYKRPQQQRSQQQGQQRLPALHPAQITTCIKQRNNLQELQRLHQRYSSSFNVVNMSALLVRLAHIHRAHADAAQSAQTQKFAVQVMQQLVPRLAECQNARQAGNATWALAVLQCEVTHGLLQSAAQQLSAQDAQLLQASQPQDIANLAWGLAKLHYNPGCSVWQHIVAAAQSRLGAFKPGELAMLMWALAETQQRLKEQQKRQKQQQQRQRVQQLQLRRQQQQQARQQQQASQEQQCQGSTSATNPSSTSSRQLAVECRTPSSSDLLAAQQMARRQSNAEASTSAATSSRAAYPKRSGSSNSSRGGFLRKAVRPLTQSALSLPFPGARQSGGNSSSSSSSDASAIVGAASSMHRFGSGSSSSSGSSVAAGARQSYASSPYQQQLQQLLPSLADVVVWQLRQGRQQYKAQEGAMLLWACGVLGYHHDGLLDTLANLQQQLLQQGRSNSQDVANSVWALGKLQALQPQLLSTAAECSSWLQHSSCQELSQVLYGTAALIRQQRQQRADSAELLPAVALWQATAAQALSGTALVGLCAAEAATLLQAAALLLEPVRQPPGRGRQQQQQQDCPGSSAHASSSVSVSASSSATSSVSSLCSMTCSLDSFDEAVAAAPVQARQLIAAVDAELCRQAEAGRQTKPFLGQHVAAMLHSLAAAGVGLSRPLQQLLLTAATAAAPKLDSQELAMTAWSAAKLFGSRQGSSEGVQALTEAVDRAAGPLLPSMNPQDLSMLAWAHGRLWDLGDSLFMHQLAQAALQQVQHFGAQALSNLTWAFAQLRHYDAALTAAVGRRTRALLGQFTPAELANLTWGLVTLRHRQAGLLRAIANHAAGTCSSWDAKACVKLAISYCSRGMPVHKYRSLLGSLADALAEQSMRAWSRLTPHELVQLAVALAVGRVRHRPCAMQIANVALAWLPRIALYDVVLLVWALAMMGQRNDALLQAVSARVAEELQASGSKQQQQQQMQPDQADLVAQHWSSAAAAAAQLSGGRGGSLHAAVEEVLQQAQQQQQQQQQAALQHGDAATHQDDGGSSAPNSSISSALSGVPIFAVIGSRLYAPQLARLAWSYKTFAHPDAGWYLAAGQLLATAWEPPSSSDGGSSSSSSSLLSSEQNNGAGTRAGSSATSSSNSSGAASHAATCSSGNGHRGVSVPGSRMGSPGLQRPVHRPVPAPAASQGLRQGQ